MKKDDDTQDKHPKHVVVLRTITSTNSLPATELLSFLLFILLNDRGRSCARVELQRNQKILHLTWCVHLSRECMSQTPLCLLSDINMNLELTWNKTWNFMVDHLWKIWRSRNKKGTGRGSVSVVGTSLTVSYSKPVGNTVDQTGQRWFLSYIVSGPPINITPEAKSCCRVTVTSNLTENTHLQYVQVSFRLCDELNMTEIKNIWPYYESE